MLPLYLGQYLGFPVNSAASSEAGERKRILSLAEAQRSQSKIEREIEAGGILENCAILKNGISERMRIVDQKR
jgi:hypothetical protein